MLDLYAAIHAALGASFTINHEGALVTIAVADAGAEDPTPLPAVFVHSEFGTAAPSNVGGHAAENAAAIDLHIETLDSPDEGWNGRRMRGEIHAAIEARVRAAEASLGDADFALVANYRDLPPLHHDGGFVSYTRIVTVRATSVEAY